MPNEDSTPLGGPQATDSPVSPVTEKWRNLSSRELRTNSVVFPAINQAKLQTYMTLLRRVARTVWRGVRSGGPGVSPGGGRGGGAPRGGAGAEPPRSENFRYF